MLTEASHFIFPENLVTLEGYQQPTLSFHADWDRPSYEAEWRLQARPHGGDSGLPPIDIHILGEGDEQRFTLVSFIMEGPGLKSSLQTPLQVDFADPKTWQKAAPFSFSVDLAAFPVAQAQGILEGEILLRPPPDLRQNPYPLARFDVTASGLSWQDHPSVSFVSAGTLEWPWLDLEKVTFEQEGTLQVNARGRLQMESMGIGELTFDFTSGPDLQTGLLFLLGEESLPFDWDTIHGQGTLEGEWPDLSGQLIVETTGLDIPGLVPSGPGKASLELSGSQKSRFEINGHLEHPALTLHTEATLGINPGASQLDAEVTRLDLTPTGSGGLELKHPFTAEINRDTHRFSIAHFNWQPMPDDIPGPAVGLEIRQAGPDAGDFSLSLRDLRTVWLQPWLELAAETPPVSLDELDLHAQWEGEESLTGTLESRASYEMDGQAPFSTHLKLRTDREILYLDRLSARQEGLLLLEGEGQFPLALHPGIPEKPWTLSLDRPLHLDIHTTEALGNWALLNALSGLEMVSPSLAIRVDGTLGAPSGDIRIQTGQIRLTDGLALHEGIPEIDELTLSLNIAETGLRLVQGEIRVAEHSLRAEAFLPMSPGSWQQLWNERELPDWSEAEGLFTLDKSNLAVFREFIPPPLRPRGNLEFSVRLQPGKQISGGLLLENAETFPILPLGTVNNIRADLRFAGTTLEVVDLRADIGDRPIIVGGEIHLDDQLQPRFDLRLEGQRVPFVRSPGLIVRGSPTMELKTDPQGITTLSGEIILNESFFMLDFTALQGGGASPETRPPYFSITEEPMASWRLQLAVKGDEFLRVRTPVFESTVSADMQLQGTLLEPFAFGQATLERGVVLFPFAAFRVREGRVTLEQSDPYSPKIHLLATTRAYGYDLTMRVSGTPDDPAIVFSSTPSLDSSEILLMVTAGRLPDTGDGRSAGSRLGGLGVFIGNNILTELGLIDPLDDRLQVRVGQDITDLGRDTIDVEYRINDSWSVIGEYDRFDAYNLNVKWRIYSR